MKATVFATALSVLVTASGAVFASDLQTRGQSFAMCAGILGVYGTILLEHGDAPSDETVARNFKIKSDLVAAEAKRILKDDEFSRLFDQSAESVVALTNAGEIDRVVGQIKVCNHLYFSLAANDGDDTEA